jgi:hypothetical protein
MYPRIDTNECERHIVEELLETLQLKMTAILTAAAIIALYLEIFNNSIAAYSVYEECKKLQRRLIEISYL